MVKNTLNIKLFRDLKILRTQTLTTALLLICGVSLLISSWSAYISLRFARDKFYEEYHFAEIFSEFKTAPLKIEQKINNVTGVKRAEARIVMQGLIYVPGQIEPAIGHFVTAPVEKGDYLNRLYLRKGRLPMMSEEVEVTVHEAFAKAHHLTLGDELSILVQGTSEKVKIVGITISPEFVYALNPSAPLPDNLHFGIIWVPQKQLEFLAKMKDEVNSVLITVERSHSSKEVLTQVDEILKPYGNLGAYERKDQLSNMFVEDEIKQQKISGLLIPSIFLFVAAFLVNIIISRLISLQRPQVATLKALGYTNREVSLHYLKIIFIMMLAGTVPGIFLGGYIGTLLTNNYKNFFHFPELSFSLSVLAIFLGFIAGFIPYMTGGLLSLRAIYKLTPAEAMLPAAPANFLPTFIERWGLHKYFKVHTRMIWRNLLIRPLRLMVIVFGLCASLALIITASAWVDVVDFLIETQFQRQQREDIRVDFKLPLGESSIRELLKIDGVLMAEGSRTIPIRLKYKNYKREALAIGRSNQNQLSKIIDRELNQIKIPQHGILLSRFFESKWDLKRGDYIDLEFLEGKQHKETIKVAGFVEDLIGPNAYIKDRLLLKMLEENTCYNSVSLKVDPHKMLSVYLELKKFPLINAVTIKQQLLKGFKETIGGMILVFTWILIIFSLMITIGIIYNSIRVTFSERAWELSSLMVLGFNKWLVLNLLAAEVIIQVLLAIIPGCLSGWGLVYLSMKLIHSETFNFPVIIDHSTFALSVLFVLLVLVGCLVIMAKMINRLKLSDALKIRE
jgi:putative ABC transport system permease protein